MFFGLVSSPVTYLLGTPKRKYRIEDAIRTQPLFLPSPSKKAGRSLSHPFDFLWYNQTVKEDEPEVENPFPEFIDSVFYFLPEYDENCRKLMVCHSHGFLSLMPTYFVQIYRVFSSTMMGIPMDYQNAIQVGLEDQGSCSKVFHNCTTDLSSMAKSALLGIILGDVEPSMYSDFTYD
ncbi:unnamed protein product [Allacma fusca]|uniref:Uncharacterized protein n=1 Tax=Allacma fusca TaxID=39272 RepID=A0A8J2KRZ1_9HEXA|nr:unnamed protein product [Allacma fusca]